MGYRVTVTEQCSPSPGNTLFSTNSYPVLGAYMSSIRNHHTLSPVVSTFGGQIDPRSAADFSDFSDFKRIPQSTATAPATPPRHATHQVDNFQSPSPHSCPPSSSLDSRGRHSLELPSARTWHCLSILFFTSCVSHSQGVESVYLTHWAGWRTTAALAQSWLGYSLTLFYYCNPRGVNFHFFYISFFVRRGSGIGEGDGI